MAETLTIADGATDSNKISGLRNIYKNLIIYAPPVLSGTTVIKVSPKSEAASVAADYVTLESGGEDVALTQGKGTPITICPFGSLFIQTAASLDGVTEVFTVDGDLA